MVTGFAFLVIPERVRGPGGPRYRCGMDDVLHPDTSLNRQTGGLPRLRRWDPLAFIFFAHGVGLAVVGVTQNALLVSLLSGTLALVRLGVTWLVPHGTERTPKFITSVVSTTLAFAVVLADGGTESPFFFWILLLLGWQVLIFDQRRFRMLGIFTLAAYIVVIGFTFEYTAAAVFRLALLVAFIVTLALGRWILDQREAEVARLDDVVKAIIDDAPMAMAVLDADRDTLLYANGAAREMGIASRDSMAHLLLDDAANPQRITTLAELVVGGSFRQSPVRTYRHIGSPRAEYRIGFHPRRIGQARPLVLVYGFSIDEDDE